jgi:hypothetical protein
MNHDLADFAEELAGIIWVVLGGTDEDKVADNMESFLERHTDFTLEERLYFYKGIERIVFPGIQRIELECLILLSYRRTMHVRQVRRSQGN